MQTGTKKPMAVPSSGGRKIHVIGHEITLKLICRETDGEYFVFEAVTPPGVGMALHVHRHEDEFFRVLEGEFEFQLDQQIQKVTSGAMVNFPKNIPHAFRNVGTKPGRTFWTVMPGANFEKFFEELGSLPADQEPDMGKVTEIFNSHDIKILPPQ
jgi:mannose-6-phosphate isomerase-like protein (cupin superfamily)